MAKFNSETSAKFFVDQWPYNFSPWFLHHVMKLSYVVGDSSLAHCCLCLWAGLQCTFQYKRSCSFITSRCWIHGKWNFCKNYPCFLCHVPKKQQFIKTKLISKITKHLQIIKLHWGFKLRRQNPHYILNTRHRCQWTTL